MNPFHLDEPHLDETVLHEYMDGMLSVDARRAERAEVEAHLANCEGCRSRLAELQWLFVALENVSEEEPSRDFALSTMTILNARANPVRTPALRFLTIQLLVTTIVAVLLWPFLSQSSWQTTIRWAQPLQLQLAMWQLEAHWPVLLSSDMQWTQTMTGLRQQVGERWGQGLDLSLLSESVPELSITLWLALLGGIFLLWALATRWLLLLPATQQPQYTTDGETK